MKKVMTSALAASLLFGTAVSTGFAANGSDFSDIGNSYAKEAILNLQSKGILTGVDGTRFNPKGILTRAEYVTVIVKALGLSIEMGNKSTFTDVPEWAVPYVTAAVQAGLVDGVGNGKFDPNAPVTREMAAVILVRALHATGVTLEGEDDPLTFTDAKDISAWAKSYIAIAVKHGLIKGNSDGSFSPKGKASREMAAVLGSNLLTAIEQSLPKPSTPDVTEPEVAQPDTPETKPTTPTTSTSSSGGGSSNGGGGGGGGGGYIPPVTPVVSLSSITITTPANKLSYAIGEDLDLAGMVVTGTYSDGSKGAIAVTAANVSGYDKTKTGSQTLTVTVSGKTTNFTVTVAKKDEEAATLSSIEITALPDKLDYVIGEELDLTGLEVTGHYSDDSTKVLEVTSDNVTGFNSSAAVESQTLTITVGEFTSTLEISIREKEEPPVEEATLSSIEIASPPTKTEYKVGEELDLSGLVVTGHYSDDTTKQEDVSIENLSGFNSSAAAENQEVVVTINGQTATFNVTIIDDEPPVTTPVEVFSVHIESSNADQTVATVGDTITLSFKTNEFVQEQTSFNIGGNHLTTFESVDGGEGFFINTATYVVDEFDKLGKMSFQINVKNAAGTYSPTIEATNDESSVTIVAAAVEVDKTALSDAITTEVGEDRADLKYVLELDKYTETTWAAYEKAIEHAIAVESNENASQEEVTQAAEDLGIAKAALLNQVISDASLTVVEGGGLLVQFTIDTDVDFETDDIILSYYTEGEEDKNALLPIHNTIEDNDLVKNKEWSGYLWDVENGSSYSSGTEKDPDYSDKISANTKLASLVKKGFHAPDADMDYVEIDWTKPATYVVVIAYVDADKKVREKRVHFTVEPNATEPTEPTTPVEPEPIPTPET